MTTPHPERRARYGAACVRTLLTALGLTAVAAAGPARASVAVPQGGATPQATRKTPAGALQRGELRAGRELAERLQVAETLRIQDGEASMVELDFETLRRPEMSSVEAAAQRNEWRSQVRVSNFAVGHSKGRVEAAAQRNEWSSQVRVSNFAVGHSKGKSDWLMVDKAHIADLRGVDGEPVDASRWKPVPGFSNDTDALVGLTLAEGEVLTFRMGAAPETAELDDDVLWLPTRVLVGTGSVPVGPDSNERRAREIVGYGVRLHATHRPLRWDAAVGTWTTGLIVALQRLGQADGSDDLARPIQLSFVDMTRGVQVDPPSLRLHRSGAAGSATASLAYSPREAAFVEFAIAGDLPGDPVKIAVEPALAGLAVVPENGHPLGLGLEVVEVTVTLLAEDGRPLVASAAMELTVRSGDSTAPAIIEVPAGSASTTFELRTAGAGKEAVQVDAAGVASRTIELTFGLPWGLLFACLLGGLVGGLLRKPRGPRDMGLGILVGVVAFLLATLGISITKVGSEHALHEVGAFLIAVLAALGGTELLPDAGPRAKPPVSG